MGLKEVINSSRGKLIIAVVLGFGLSTFFRKECKDEECMKFEAPPMDKINGQLFEYNTKCYRFKNTPGDCSDKRKTVTMH
jgi:hypothetical protein